MTKLAMCLTLVIPIPLATEQSSPPITRVSDVAYVGPWPPFALVEVSPPPTFIEFAVLQKDGMAWLAQTADNNSYVKRRGQGLRSLEQIKMCESKGDYGAVSKTRKFLGGYQFDQPTFDGAAPEGWAGVPPNEAPPEIQDQAAANLQAARGNSPWPTCG